MPATMQSLGIDRLPVEEQLALVREIWDSIAATGPRPMLTEEQRLELRRRVAEDDADPDGLVPWEQVKAEALRRVQRVSLSAGFVQHQGVAGDPGC